MKTHISSPIHGSKEKPSGFIDEQSVHHPADRGIPEEFDLYRAKLVNFTQNNQNHHVAFKMVTTLGQTRVDDFLWFIDPEACLPLRQQPLRQQQRRQRQPQSLPPQFFTIPQHGGLTLYKSQSLSA